jgi:hypothetical protein
MRTAGHDWATTALGQHFAFCLAGCHGRSPFDSCRNYPRVRKSPSMPKKPTHALQQITPSLDHLVGTGEQGRRHVEAERVGGLKINLKLDRGRLLNREF